MKKFILFFAIMFLFCGIQSKACEDKPIPLPSPTETPLLINQL